MKQENRNKTMLQGSFSLEKGDDGTYSAVFSMLFKDGTRDCEVFPTDITDKEYFLHQLGAKKFDYIDYIANRYGS